MPPLQACPGQVQVSWFRIPRHNSRAAGSCDWQSAKCRFRPFLVIDCHFGDYIKVSAVLRIFLFDQTFPLDTKRDAPVDLDSEIIARMRALMALDKVSKPSDFQIRVGKNGSVLVNMKTGRALVIYDDLSELHDLEELGLDVTDTDKTTDMEY